MLSPLAELNASNNNNSISIGGGEKIGGNVNIHDKDDNAILILVVYFSATNNTKSVAKKIRAESQTDIYDIVPVVHYTSAEINYAAIIVAQIPRNAIGISVPQISGDIENLSEYDGYPI